MSLLAKTKYVAPNKPAANSGITLFCSANAVACLWVRLVLAEKEVDGARLQIERPGRPSADFALLNSAQTLPTLADRDAVIYAARVIVEYIDERYPHPPMMPPDPAQRARLRMVLDRIETDFFSLFPAAEMGTSASGREARKKLVERLADSVPLFGGRSWFLGQDHSIVDSAWSALFWKIAEIKLDLPPSADPLRGYAQRAFARPAFVRVSQAVATR